MKKIQNNNLCTKSKKGVFGLFPFILLLSVLFFTISAVVGGMTRTVQFNQQVYLTEAYSEGEKQLAAASLYANDSLEYAISKVAWYLASKGVATTDFANAPKSSDGILYWYSDDFTADSKFAIPYDSSNGLSATIDKNLAKEFSIYADNALERFAKDNLEFPRELKATFAEDSSDPDVPRKNIVSIASSESTDKSKFFLKVPDPNNPETNQPIARLYRNFGIQLKTAIPYWQLYDNAKEEAQKAPQKHDELKTLTTGLTDEILHQDYYCESPAAALGKKTSCNQKPSCEEIFTSYQGTADSPEKKIGDKIAEWSDDSDNPAPRIEYAKVSLTPSTIVSARNNPPSYAYDPITSGSPDTNCGCKQWSPICSGSNSHSCSSYSTDAGCNSDSFCSWDGSACQPKTCSTWSNDQSACSSAGCSWAAQGSCALYFLKLKCSATCGYNYDYAADVQVNVKSDKKVFVEDGWKDFVFSFMEKFRMEDENIENPKTYQTGVGTPNP